ncbi:MULTISPECIES: biofilm development regulator YmgB/AriR family protein [Kosakonia]|nr:MULTISPECIES: biofilm development regulator YmgB/AriR family protein [Kosakonia]MDN2486544.1 biofilm development regulator YmgB/AriR family protein [Kosakonia sacchari]NUL36382.1 two-component-system connector protein AriR [Kosakonia sacchari]QOV62152.1 two-component-system connector protein AriR [Kosakonia pseudosacchari]WBU51314.1 biofilm development regulator YmgB/AriR family protein [Kosakonia pseudosacchari]
MSQAMLESSDGYENLPDLSLMEYFRSGGEKLAEESAILGVAIRRIVAADERITHKALILELIRMIESTDDVVRSDIIRNTLEIVVHHTTDDI